MSISSLMDTSDFPVELRMILCCLRKFFSNDGDRNVEKVPMEEIDWDLFFSQAGRHKVIPFLNATSQFLAENDCPDSVLDALRQGSEQNTWNNIAMTVELVHLAGLFERNNIPCIAIKGTAMALLLYGNLERRSSSDIDVLVPRDAVEEAHRVLLRSGYVRQSRYPGHRVLEAARKSLLHHYHYRHEMTGLSVELHWRLTVYRSVLSIKFDTINANTQAVKIGDREVKTLSSEHMTLLLFWHGALNKWDALSRVCDVAQAIRKLDTLNWSNLLERGSRVGVFRSILAGLILSNVLLGTALPDEVRVAAERDSALPHLIRDVAGGLLACDSGTDALAALLKDTRWRVRLERGLRYKIEVALTNLGSENSLRLIGIE